MHATRLYTILLVSFFYSATASAQVFDPGPSDSALFTNVYDLPGDALPSNDLGGVAGEFTQVNLGDLGFIESNFDIRDGVEANISGGIVGNGFTAHNGNAVTDFYRLKLGKVAPKGVADVARLQVVASRLPEFWRIQLP